MAIYHTPVRQNNVSLRVCVCLCTCVWFRWNPRRSACLCSVPLPYGGCLVSERFSRIRNRFQQNGQTRKLINMLFPLPVLNDGIYCASVRASVLIASLRWGGCTAWKHFLHCAQADWEEIFLVAIGHCSATNLTPIWPRGLCFRL